MVTSHNGNIVFRTERTGQTTRPKKPRWTKQLHWRYEAELQFIKYARCGVQFRKHKSPAGNWVVGYAGCYDRDLVRLDRALAIRANGWKMLDDWRRLLPRPKLGW